MIAIVSSLLLAAAPVTGQAGSTAPAAPAKAKAICRREAETGSIMPGKRTCHTLAEWKEIDAINAKAVDNFRDQANSGRGSN